MSPSPAVPSVPPPASSHGWPIERVVSHLLSQFVAPELTGSELSSATQRAVCQNNYVESWKLLPEHVRLQCTEERDRRRYQQLCGIAWDTSRDPEERYKITTAVSHVAAAQRETHAYKDWLRDRWYDVSERLYGRADAVLTDEPTSVPKEDGYRCFRKREQGEPITLLLLLEMSDMELAILREVWREQRDAAARRLMAGRKEARPRSKAQRKTERSRQSPLYSIFTASASSSRAAHNSPAVAVVTDCEEKYPSAVSFSAAAQSSRAGGWTMTALVSHHLKRVAWPEATLSEAVQRAVCRGVSTAALPEYARLRVAKQDVGVYQQLWGLEWHSSTAEERYIATTAVPHKAALQREMQAYDRWLRRRIHDVAARQLRDHHTDSFHVPHVVPKQDGYCAFRELRRGAPVALLTLCDMTSVERGVLCKVWAEEQTTIRQVCQDLSYKLAVAEEKKRAQSRKERKRQRQR